MMAGRQATARCWHCGGESRCDCISCAVPDGKTQWISGQCIVCCRREILDRQRLAGGGSVDLSDLQPQARGAVLSALQKEKEHRFANRKLWNLYRLVVGDHEQGGNKMESKNETPVPEFILTFDDLALLVLQEKLKAFPLQSLVAKRDQYPEHRMKDVTHNTGEVVSDETQLKRYGGGTCRHVVLTLQGLNCLGRALAREAGNKRYYRKFGFSSRDLYSSEYIDFRFHRVLDVVEVVSPTAFTELLKTYDDEMELADAQAAERVKELGWVKWTHRADEKNESPEAQALQPDTPGTERV